MWVATFLSERDYARYASGSAVAMGIEQRAGGGWDFESIRAVIIYKCALFVKSFAKRCRRGFQPVPGPGLVPARYDETKERHGGRSLQDRGRSLQDRGRSLQDRGRCRQGGRGSCRGGRVGVGDWGCRF